MLNLIAAVGRNNEIGKNKKLIWSLPADLLFFKEVTKGHLIAMGSKTFNDLPYVLPERRHIILSRYGEFNKDIEDSLVIKEREEFIDFVIKISKIQEIFVIGGELIFQMFIEFADKIILTEIDAEDVEADKFFPEFNKEEFEITEIGFDEDNGISF